MSVVVVGQLGRDLVLGVGQWPDAGGSTSVRARRELLGGKGANQAVGLRQVGVADVALVAVGGTDAAGRHVLEQAAQDGIDVRGVRRRGTTALLVDLVDGDGSRRLVEDVPATALVQPEDVDAAADLLRSAAVVSLQLQQPAQALLRAAAIATEAGARILLDGGQDGPERDRLRALAEVVRADAVEAQLLCGRPVRCEQDAREAAATLLERGPSLVAIAVPHQGDLVAWPDGSRLLPLAGAPVVDPTGAGDAFTAGLVAALHDGCPPAEAAALANRAAAATVTHLGGRPRLQGLRR